MGVEILVHAFDHDGIKKGSFATIKDDDQLSVSPWGNREGLPNYCVLRISDATKSQVENFLDGWVREISLELINSNELGRRYKLSVNPKIIEIFGENKGFKQEFVDYLEMEYGAILVSFSKPQGHATFDIPNTDWQALRNDVIDKFEQTIDGHRYYFNNTDVDTIIASGGKATFNSVEAILKIVDRLA